MYEGWVTKGGLDVDLRNYSIRRIYRCQETDTLIYVYPIRNNVEGYLYETKIKYGPRETKGFNDLALAFSGGIFTNPHLKARTTLSLGRDGEQQIGLTEEHKRHKH